MESEKIDGNDGMAPMRPMRREGLGDRWRPGGGEGRGAAACLDQSHPDPAVLGQRME